MWRLTARPRRRLSAASAFCRAKAVACSFCSFARRKSLLLALLATRRRHPRSPRHPPSLLLPQRVVVQVAVLAPRQAAAPAAALVVRERVLLPVDAPLETLEVRVVRVLAQEHVLAGSARRSTAASTESRILPSRYDILRVLRARRVRRVVPEGGRGGCMRISPRAARARRRAALAAFAAWRAASRNCCGGSTVARCNSDSALFSSVASVRNTARARDVRSAARVRLFRRGEPASRELELAPLAPDALDPAQMRRPSRNSEHAVARARASGAATPSSEARHSGHIHSASGTSARGEIRHPRCHPRRHRRTPASRQLRRRRRLRASKRQPRAWSRTPRTGSSASSSRSRALSEMTYAQSPLRDLTAHLDLLPVRLHRTRLRLFLLLLRFRKRFSFSVALRGSLQIHALVLLLLLLLLLLLFLLFLGKPFVGVASGAAAVVCVFSPRAAAGARVSFAGPEARDSFSFFVCFPFPGLPFAVCVSSKNP